MAGLLWLASQDVTPPCLPPQQKQGVFLSRASSISLTVEHALESFSFLNTSDMEDSEGSEEEPLQDERCTAGLAGRGVGQDAALGQLGWGMPSSSRVPRHHHSSGQVQVKKQQDLALLVAQFYPASLHGGWAGRQPLCPWDLVLHPALMP